MRKKGSLIFYILTLFISFYILPLLVKNMAAAMLFMLILIPAISIMTGLIHGIKNGFDIRLALCALILFVPTIFIFYNTSAWPYAPVYAVLVFVFDLFGGWIGKHEKR